MPSRLRRDDSGLGLGTRGSGLGARGSDRPGVARGNGGKFKRLVASDTASFPSPEPRFPPYRAARRREPRTPMRNCLRRATAGHRCAYNLRHAFQHSLVPVVQRRATRPGARGTAAAPQSRPDDHGDTVARDWHWRQHHDLHRGERAPAATRLRAWSNHPVSWTSAALGAALASAPARIRTTSTSVSAPAPSTASTRIRGFPRR